MGEAAREPIGRRPGRAAIFTGMAILLLGVVVALALVADVVVHLINQEGISPLQLGGMWLVIALLATGGSVARLGLARARKASPNRPPRH